MNTIYTIKPGDNLPSISVKLYGDASKVADLMTANNMNSQTSNLLMPGQIIKLPYPPTVPQTNWLLIGGGILALGIITAVIIKSA